MLLEEYQARGRLQEALERTFIGKDGTIAPILRVFTTTKPINPSRVMPAGYDWRARWNENLDQLLILRELVFRWGADVRKPFFYT